MKTALLVWGALAAALTSFSGCGTVPADTHTAGIAIESTDLEKLRSAAVRIMREEGFVPLPASGDASVLAFGSGNSTPLDRLTAANARRPAAGMADYMMLNASGQANSESGRNAATEGGMGREMESGDFDPRQNSIVTLHLHPEGGRTRIVGYVSARYRLAEVAAAARSDPGLRLLAILESDQQLLHQLTEIKQAAEK